jgi:hypothetical protein
MVNSQRRRGSQPQLSSHQIHQEKHRKAAICLLGAVSGVLSVLGHAETHLNKQPMHTSALTGQNWLDELLTGAKLRVFIITHCTTVDSWDYFYSHVQATLFDFEDKWE